MNYHIFFSPTGITEKIVAHIGDKFSSAKGIDLSQAHVSSYALNADDFCIVGVPSFGGRVPDIAAKRLQQISGNGTPAFLLITYGARAYEDTLKELKDIMERQGFVCIGAAAMVTEHSIIGQIAAGRPNSKDYLELDCFTAEIQKRLQRGAGSVQVPGNTPYKEYHASSMGIKASEDCIHCGLCAKSCPAGAISPESPKDTDEGKCISCMRCVHICPAHARSGNAAKIHILSEKLKEICQPDKPNEFF